MTDQSDLSERETISIEIPLDPAHRRMDLSLREAGVDVEEIVAGNVAPNVEQTLYKIMQATKYEDQQ